MGGTLVFAHYLRYKHRLDEMAVVRDRMDPEIDAYNEKTKKEAIQLDIYRQKFFEWRQERRDSTKSWIRLRPASINSSEVA